MSTANAMRETFKKEIPFSESELTHLGSFKSILPPEAKKIVEEIEDRKRAYLPELMRLLRLLRDQISEYISSLEKMHGVNGDTNQPKI